MGLYVPMVNRDFWGKLGLELQQAILKLWTDNLPAYRASAATAQEEGRKELAQHGVSFVDVAQDELDRVRKKMLAEQDKTAADAHMSPELVKLVMTDVGA